MQLIWIAYVSVSPGGKVSVKNIEYSQRYSDYKNYENRDFDIRLIS